MTAEIISDLIRDRESNKDLNGVPVFAVYRPNCPAAGHSHGHLLGLDSGSPSESPES